MFRDLYKKANDEIKGDRAILDKAFLQAAQPVKEKSPVIKYSFIGTVVAAVMVLGAVFANPTVFTNRTEDIGALGEDGDNVTVTTSDDTELNLTVQNNDVAIVNEMVESVDETAVKNSVTEDKKEKIAMPRVEAAEEQEGYGLAVMSFDGDDAVIEEPTEEVMIKFFIRDRNVVEDVTEEATDSIEESVLTFSYMYDLSCGYAAVTEGFVNTEVYSVTSREEAIERARKEYNGEYDGVEVYYDPIECVWKVAFWCDDEVASEVVVYMNSDGVTLMIVNLA